MTPPLVTCVMLTRWPERMAMVSDALASFHLQTYPNRELLVVNEGEPLSSRDRRVRVINTGPRSSLGGQRDFGLVAASGEYVATWDDDDASCSRRLELQVERAERGADYVICHRLWLADGDLEPVCEASAVAYVTALVRRSAALGAGGHGPGDHGEDAALFRRMQDAGARVSVMDEPLYIYRRHGANVSSASTGEGLDSWARFCVGSSDVSPAVAEVRRIRSSRTPGMIAGRR